MQDIQKSSDPQTDDIYRDSVGCIPPGTRLCPKCGKWPKEFWYDGSCIEHGRPEPVEGRWYYLRYEGEWTPQPWQYIAAMGFAEDLEAWLPIPTVEEMLLTTRGKI